MLIIRLTRTGKKNKPQYRIVVQEKSKATTSSFIEQVGFFNPHAQEGGTELKEERIKYWISKGAQTSPTVHNMLVKNSVIEGKSIPLGRPKKKKKDDETDESKEQVDKPETDDSKEKPKEQEQTKDQAEEKKQKAEPKQEKDEKVEEQTKDSDSKKEESKEEDTNKS